VTDRRLRNQDWIVTNQSGVVHGYPGAQLAVLMDIRDELKNLNGLLRCDQFLSIPAVLRQIKSNTAKPKEAKKR
jgi:hypothetical protein